jgi:hypothetical protein
MSRDTPRKRRPISPRQARLLTVLGFRYSAGRDAYVLRLIGGRFGVVFQVEPVPARARGSQPLQSRSQARTSDVEPEATESVSGQPAGPDSST